MRHNLNKLTFLTGSVEMLERASAVPARPTWDERTIAFLGAFSRNLLNDARARSFPDIAAYAFWIRNASLRQIKDHYYPRVDDRLGRGLAFHVAPSNVPINFAVSFTSSLLAGNANIVRLSNKPYEQVDIVVDSLKKTFQEGFRDMEARLILVRYDHDEAITAYLSSLCDVRVVWGGNQTIEAVRRAALPPRAIEMTFADRHSLALMNADAVAAANPAALDRLAADFYTDTYYIDQNACSSPRLVAWFGARVDEARESFWDVVERLVARDYPFRDIQAVDKLDQFCRLAAINPRVRLVSRDNAVVRVEVPELDSDLMEYKLGGGYFFEYRTDGLEALAPVLGKPCQTLSYYGMDPSAIQRFVMERGFRGCDRIVPVGKTMDLTFKWDGYDMIEAMSRIVYCPEYCCLTTQGDRNKWNETNQ